MAVAKGDKGIFREAERQGWTIKTTRNGHVKMTAPNGDTMFTASSRSDSRGRRNMIAEMRRMGFIWPVLRKGKRRRMKRPVTADTLNED